MTATYYGRSPIRGQSVERMDQVSAECTLQLAQQMLNWNNCKGSNQRLRKFSILSPITADSIDLQQGERPG